MMCVGHFAFKKALAPIISYYCCVSFMLRHWPREPLLSGRSKVQGVGQGTGYRVHVQGWGTPVG